MADQVTYDPGKMMLVGQVKKVMNDVHWHTGRLLQEVSIHEMDEMEAIHLELQALEQRFLKLMPAIMEKFAR